MEDAFGELFFGTLGDLLVVDGFRHEEDGEVLGVGVEALEKVEGVTLLFGTQEGWLFGEGVDDAVTQTKYAGVAE